MRINTDILQLAFSETLLANRQPIPHDLVNPALFHYSPKAGKLDPKEVDLLSKNSNDPKLHPPHIFTGENMHPVFLPKLMFEGISNDPNGCHLSLIPEENPHRPGGYDRKQHKEVNCQILDRLCKYFLEAFNLRLEYIKTPPKNTNEASMFNQVPCNAGTLFRLICSRCKDHPRYSVVVRGKFPKCDTVANQGCFLVHVEEIFFHDVLCRTPWEQQPGRRTANSDGGMGYHLWKVPGGAKALLGSTYDDFVAELRTWNKPGEKPPAGANPQKLGPPPSEGILNFNQQAHCWDDRRQIQFHSPLWPQLQGNNITKNQVVIVYVTVCHMGFCREFTRYIPHRNPRELNQSTTAYLPGKWPVDPTWHAYIHLYYVDFLALVGGHQLNKARTALVPYGESTYSHQQMHGDMRHRHFNSTGDNKTLENLSKPGSFNFPMDSPRWILSMNEFMNICTCPGEVNFVEGSHPHAGKAYIHNPNQIVQWRPCGNVQVRSIRHRCDWDCVQPMTSYKTYCPPTHIGLIPEDELSDTIRRREYDLQLVVMEAQKRSKDRKAAVGLDDYTLCLHRKVRANY